MALKRISPCRQNTSEVGALRLGAASHHEKEPNARTGSKSRARCSDLVEVEILSKMIERVENLRESRESSRESRIFEK